MTGYELHPDALADLDEILGYIRADNLDAAHVDRKARGVRLEPGTTKNQADFRGPTKGESPAGRAILNSMRPVDAFYENGRLRPVALVFQMRAIPKTS
jgi:plasmid stabilization system protein ParE